MSSCGACNSCSLYGIRTCSAVASGTKDSRCVATANATTCGLTGLCASGGMCEASTAQCKGAELRRLRVHTPRVLRGDQQYHLPRRPAAMPCGNYACASLQGCKQAPCSSSADCASGNICERGHVQKSGGAIGATCSKVHSPCAAGTCVDGVCCQQCLLRALPDLQRVHPRDLHGRGRPRRCRAAQHVPDVERRCGNTGTCTASKKVRAVSAGHEVRPQDPFCSDCRHADQRRNVRRQRQLSGPPR